MPARQKSDVDAALHTLKQRLQERFGGRFIALRLFGSWGWGGVNEDSDVDVCVVIDTLTTIEHRAVIDLVSDVAMELEMPLAPIVWSQNDLDRRLALEQALAEDIANKGVVV